MARKGILRRIPRWSLYVMLAVELWNAFGGITESRNYGITELGILRIYGMPNGGVPDGGSTELWK